jgi:hypothetical protein
MSTLTTPEAAPVRTKPFAPWPFFEPDEIEAVTDVLQSGQVNYWTGEEGRNFEQEFAAYTGSKYAVTLANGTVALELALLALRIKCGAEVIVPCRTFVATAGVVALHGAVPVFADIDPVSQNITVDSIRAVLTPRTRAVIVVHLGGWPCDMDPILELAREHNLYVIEDCAQAHGALYKGRSVGTFGDVAGWSFCQDKIITTGGEGGMLTTDNPNIWDRAWSYKDHGKSYDAIYHRAHGPGFRWVHESLGSNWRMTEMQSAIGRRALTKLPDWVATRRHHARLLDMRFAEIPGLRTTIPTPDYHHVYYKQYVFVEPDRLKDDWDRDRIMVEINELGIPCFGGICSEIYLEKAFEHTGWQPAERFPVARQLGETSLMFMVHPTLTEQDMHDTADAVAYVMQQACR